MTDPEKLPRILTTGYAHHAFAEIESLSEHLRSDKSAPDRH